MVLSKKCVIDDNPITRWCFSNVVLLQDKNGNRKPDKETPENKIDIPIAFIQSTKLWMELNGIVDNTNLEPVMLES